MHPRSTPDPTDANSVLARVMAEQPDPDPVRPADAALAKASDVAGPHLADSQHPGDSAGGQDGKDVEDGVAGHLDYLSRLAQQLGVSDPVEDYFTPSVGRWSELHDEAERWRSAAKTADQATTSLTKPLGSLDSAWRGKDAEAFVQYMDKMGLAGNDLSDAMNGMAKALDKTANSVREIVQQLAGVLADTAETSSQAMATPAKGDQRVRQHLDEVRKPSKDLFDQVRQVVEAFVKLCDGIEGGATFDKIGMKHTFPEQNFAFPDQRVASPKVKHDGTQAQADDSTPKHDSMPSGGAAAVGGGGGVSGGGGYSGGGAGGAGTPSAEKLGSGGYVSADENLGGSQRPAAAAATGAPGGQPGTGQGGSGQGGQGGGMPMMGGMGGGGGQGGDQEHKRSSRVVGDPTDIFGRPTKTSPPVIGDED